MTEFKRKIVLLCDMLNADERNIIVHFNSYDFDKDKLAMWRDWDMDTLDAVSKVNIMKVANLFWKELHK